VTVCACLPASGRDLREGSEIDAACLPLTSKPLSLAGARGGEPLINTQASPGVTSHVSRQKLASLASRIVRRLLLTKEEFGPAIAPKR